MNLVCNYVSVLNLLRSQILSKKCFCLYLRFCHGICFFLLHDFFLLICCNNPFSSSSFTHKNTKNQNILHYFSRPKTTRKTIETFFLLSVWFVFFYHWFETEKFYIQMFASLFISFHFWLIRKTLFLWKNVKDWIFFLSRWSLLLVASLWIEGFSWTDFAYLLWVSLKRKRECVLREYKI